MPPEIAQRYPLEHLDAKAEYDSDAKGQLLPPGSSDLSLPVNHAPIVLEGFTAPPLPDGGTMPPCTEAAMYGRRTKLPGYEPQFVYFDSSAGVPVDQQLRRSRLACDTLAMAQTFDATHNDLVSALTPVDPSGSAANASDLWHYAQTIVGRRAFIAANANRICQWTRFTDRDGDTHWLGLNFQGRALVDAAQNPAGGFLYSEQLYNADGSLIAERRPVPSGTNWSIAAGDRYFEYEEIDPRDNNGWASSIPYYWARRGNVTRAVTRPKSGSVQDELENSPGNYATHAGRYERYFHEPLFNQVQHVEHGFLTTDSSGALVENPEGSTGYWFDYQEQSLNDLTPLLQTLDTWGYGFLQAAGGGYDLTSIGQLQLTLPLDQGDLNADGTLGGAAGPRGLPVTRVDVGSDGTTETTVYRFNPSGQLYGVFNVESGSAVTASYYPAGAYAGVGVSSPLLAGFLESVTTTRGRASWSATEGPARAPCPNLLGPYQWLLPATCGLDVQAQLLALGLPQEAVDIILGSAPGGAEETVTTRFDYFGLGTLHHVSNPDGTGREYRRDTDGREFSHTDEKGNVFVTRYSLQGFPISVQRVDSTGAPLGNTFLINDEEGRVLWHCDEARPGGCLPLGTPNPPNAALSQFEFTAEGDLAATIDGEGTREQIRYDYLKRPVRQTTVDSLHVDPDRVTVIEYTDDGDPSFRLHGVDALHPFGQLNESFSYDGLRRLSTHVDTSQLSWLISYSSRDLQTTMASSAWVTRAAYDGMGRLVTRSDNGIRTAQLFRRPGGLPFARTADGELPSFTTYDATGAAVFHEDSAGNQTIAVGSPTRRLAAAVTLRSDALLETLATGTVTQLDELGGSVSVREDGAGGATAPATLSRTTSITRSALGFVTRVGRPDNSFVSYERNFVGWTTAAHEQRAFGSNVTDDSVFQHNRRGQVTFVVDPGGQQSSQTYNGFGEPFVFETPGATAFISETLNYDSLGRLSTRAKGQAGLRYHFNAKGQLDLVQNLKGATLVTRQYDDLSRVVAATNVNLAAQAKGLPTPDATVSSSFSYDTLGRVTLDATQVGQHPQHQVTSAWSIGSSTWVRQVTGPSAQRTEHFDGDGRLASLTRPSGGTTQFVWLNEFEAERDSNKVGDPFRLHVDYDGLGQSMGRRYTAVDLSGGGVGNSNHGPPPGAGGVTWNQAMLRDVMGRVGSVSSAARVPSGLESTWRGVGYDAMGRVSAVLEASSLPDTSSTPTHSLSFAQVQGLGVQVSAATLAYQREAAVGSLLSVQDTSGGTPRYSAAPRSAGYQLGQVTLGNTAPRAISHDSSGRTLTDGPATYTWGDFDELAAVSDSAGVTEVMLYDGLGRLAGRATRQGGGLGFKESYCYDGAQLAAAFDSGNNLAWEATWGPGLDSLVAVNLPAGEYLAVSDFRRDLVGLFNPTNNRLEYSAQYTPEGRSCTEDAVLGVSCAEVDATRCPSMAAQPFGYHGAWKSETSGLVYFRNRWYSTELGEFLSQDAAGFTDSFSLYAFNGFDPVNRWDPLGLSSAGLTPPPLVQATPQFHRDASLDAERAAGVAAAAPMPANRVGQTTAAPGRAAGSHRPSPPPPLRPAQLLGETAQMDQLNPYIKLKFDNLEIAERSRSLRDPHAALPELPPGITLNENPALRRKLPGAGFEHPDERFHREFMRRFERDTQIGIYLGTLPLTPLFGPELAVGEGVEAAAAGTAGGGGSGETVLYRLITEEEPAANFLSNAARGLRPRGPEITNRAIHEGISTFNSLEKAKEKIEVLQRGGKTVYGIAELRIPAGAADVTIAKTLGAGHYTVTGPAEAIAGYWRASWLFW